MRLLGAGGLMQRFGNVILAVQPPCIDEGTGLALGYRHIVDDLRLVDLMTGRHGPGARDFDERPVFPREPMVRGLRELPDERREPLSLPRI